MNKPATFVSLESARRLAVAKQHLAGRLPANPTKESILSTVRDLCYVQWDPVDAVAPSHIVSLWSRLGNKFRRSDLERLLWNEKKLFLHWTPIASIVLTADYPIYSSMMRRYPDSLSKSWGGQREAARKFLAKHAELRKRILGELKKKGPLQASQFQDHDGSARSRDGWTPGSNVTRMLYHLLMTGDVMIVGHEGYRNLYDLAEKFLPSWIDKKKLSEEEFEREAAERAIQAMGIAFPQEIHLYFPRGRYSNLEKALQSLVEESRIHRVQVEGITDRNERYIHDKDAQLLESLDSDWEPRMTLLAPFDTLLTVRGWTRRMFGFDHLLEQFFPESKRKYGTWVYPILYGDRIIGRADLLRDKKTEKLIVKSVHAEPGASDGDEVSSKIAEALEELGEFLGVKNVEYSSHVPSVWRKSFH